MTLQEYARAIAEAARAEEREACAKIADLCDDTEKWGIEGAGMVNLLSQMIRARSAKGA